MTKHYTQRPTYFQPKNVRYFQVRSTIGKEWLILDSVNSDILEVRKSENAAINATARHERKLVESTLSYLRHESESVRFQIAFAKDPATKARLHYYLEGLNSAVSTLYTRSDV